MLDHIGSLIPVICIQFSEQTYGYFNYRGWLMQNVPDNVKDVARIPSGFAVIAALLFNDSASLLS